MKKMIFFVAALGITALLSWRWFQPLRDQGFESAGRALIKMCSLVQRAHKDVYGVYQLDPDKLRNCLESLPDGYVLYFSREELPESYRQILPDASLPYLAKDSYRLLLAVPHRFRPEIIFWTIDPNEVPVLLPERMKK